MVWLWWAALAHNRECPSRSLSSTGHSCIQGTFPPWVVSGRYWAEATSLKISKQRDFFDRTRILSPWCPNPSMWLWLAINHHTNPFLSYTIHPSQKHEQGMMAPACNLETAHLSGEKGSSRVFWCYFQVQVLWLSQRYGKKRGLTALVF